jgi:hypothetical protein
MNLAQLKTSRALWLRREKYRKAKHTAAAKAGDEKATAKWHGLLVASRSMLVRRDAQIAKAGGATPRIITSAQLGLRFQYVWGGKGKPYRGAGHYTAGHRCANAIDLAHEMRSDHAFHMGKGWGGLSYEVMVADDGTIGFGNPVARKSAAVAVNNAGMVNVCCPGTTGDRMTVAQKASVRWLMQNWHTLKVPKAYRLPQKADSLTWKVHRDWPSQSTACPGVMKADYQDVWNG